MNDMTAAKSFRDTLSAATPAQRSHVAEVVKDAITEYAIETGMTAKEALQMERIVFNPDETLHSIRPTPH